MQSMSEMEKLAYEYMTEGRERLYENNLNIAAQLVQNALHLYKRVGNLKMYAMCLNLAGVIFAALGNEAMAVDYYLEGLEIATEHHYGGITTLFYNNIGTRYQELGEHEKAIMYFMKSEKETQNPECQKEERYNSWCLVTYLNLMNSYTALKQYDLAEGCLEKAKHLLSADDRNQISVMISEYRLYWATGKSEYAYAHINELVDKAMLDTNATDYVQDMKDVCDLLMQMKEYELWKKVICSFEVFSKEQGSVHFELVLTEMWMNYYKNIGDMNRYIQLCVEHAELYQKQKKVADGERAAAIDMKIELQEKEAARKKAELQSTTDSLTGLGNRYLLETDVSSLLKDANKNQIEVAIGVLDIDCFKQKNDTYGHVQGDESLCMVAKVVKEAVAGRGRAYRFGGDEFVLLIEDGSEKNVTEIAEKIKRELHNLQIENHNSVVVPELTISQGYSRLKTENVQTQKELLDYADKALYKVKENGRNGYCISLKNEKAVLTS